jgi:hypothetical protein
MLSNCNIMFGEEYEKDILKISMSDNTWIYTSTPPYAFME